MNVARNIDTHLHDILPGPKNTVSVVFLSWVEPKIVALFTATTSASISIQVGLKFPLFSGYATQELKIKFIVHFLKHLLVCCL